jgi:hypothetical protein
MFRASSLRFTVALVLASLVLPASTALAQDAPVFPAAPPAPAAPYPFMTLPPPPPPPVRRHRSVPMMVTGMVLCGLGATVTVVGGVFLGLALPGLKNDDDGIAAAMTALGAGTMGSGALLGAVGAALWGVGGTSPSATSAARAVPQVSAGPGGVALRWTF